MGRINKEMTPRNAKTLDDICSLARDNIDFRKDFWACLDEVSFTIAEQKMGEGSKQRISIPRDVFEQIINWYNTGKKTIK